jgi:hypothetical protein
MSKPHWLVAALICSFVATPTISSTGTGFSKAN